MDDIAFCFVYRMDIFLDKVVLLSEQLNRSDIFDDFNRYLELLIMMYQNLKSYISSFVKSRSPCISDLS